MRRNLDLGTMNNKRLFLRKSIHAHLETPDEEKHTLRRHLTGLQLAAIGVGAIIGAGIFVITGQAAAIYAGPGVVISFMIAALVCLFTGLCYAELASMIPASGGSYAYAYVALGEFPAWIVGWAITAQCLISVSTVSVGWAGYFVSFLQDFGIHLSESFTKAPLTYTTDSGWMWSGALVNLPALFLIVLVGVFVSVGIRAAARFNNLMVVTKLCAIVLFIVLGIPYIQADNLIPLIPDNTGLFGQFGWSGILRASGLVFFAYIGFDTVATLAQEAVHPQKDLPRGILGSLGLSTLAYILTALVLTGVVSYKLLNVPDPMSVALNAMGPAFVWLKFIVKLAILAGLASVVLVQLLGLTRVVYAISRDGLLPPAFGRVHQGTKTPLFASIVTALISMSAAAFLPINVLGELVSIMTLFLFAIVCLGVLVLRSTHPKHERRFTVPLVPWIPILGSAACLAQMCFFPLMTWVQWAGWILVGVAVYFSYGVHHSKLWRRLKSSR